MRDDSGREVRRTNYCNFLLHSIKLLKRLISVDMAQASPGRCPALLAACGSAGLVPGEMPRRTGRTLLASPKYCYYCTFITTILVIIIIIIITIMVTTISKLL